MNQQATLELVPALRAPRAARAFVAETLTAWNVQADKVEEAQLKVDLAYQPEQLDQDEVERAIQAAISQSGAQGPRDQGKVMGLLSARLRGKADMKAVAARVQAQLSAPS